MSRAVFLFLPNWRLLTVAARLESVAREPLLAFLRDRVSERKRRLFAVACCRRIWRRLKDGRSREAVNVAERYADGLATDAERKGALKRADAAYTAVTGDEDAAEGAACFALDANEEPDAPDFDFVESAASEAAFASRNHNREVATQLAFLQDIFANPVLPVAADPAWLTAQVLTIARAAYDQRIMPWGRVNPLRLVVLADALEDAGCEEAAILGHLRGPGFHVRGCWPVDLFLGLS